MKEGTVQSSNISNILDVYYTRNTGSGERSATIEFQFFGGEPQVLVLTQFSASSTNDPYDEVMRRPGPNCRKSESMRISFTSATSLRSITTPCATIRSATTKRSMWRIGWLIRCIRYIGVDRPYRRFSVRSEGRLFLAAQPRGRFLSGQLRPGTSAPFGGPYGYAGVESPDVLCDQYDAAAQPAQPGYVGQSRSKVRAQICNDTLYVVTGCYYANTNTTTTDRDGKVCPVPTNYFKVLLRTRTGYDR